MVLDCIDSWPLTPYLLSCAIMYDVIVQKICYASKLYIIKVKLIYFVMDTTFISSPEAKEIYVFHEWLATHEIYIFSLHLME